MAHRLADAVSALLGIILAATPAALWIAWSPIVFAIVFGAAIASAVLLVLLHGLAASETDSPQAPRLPDAFVAEIHALFPLTYHHSHAPAARFRRAMAKLSDLLGTGAGR